MRGQYCKKPLNNSFGFPIPLIGTHIALHLFYFCNNVRKTSVTKLPLFMLSLCVMLTLHVEFMRNVDNSDEDYPLSSSSIKPSGTHSSTANVNVLV